MKAMQRFPKARYPWPTGTSRWERPPASTLDATAKQYRRRDQRSNLRKSGAAPADLVSELERLRDGGLINRKRHPAKSEYTSAVNFIRDVPGENWMSPES